MQLPVIDNTWTLFLDRDGVINEEIHHGYVLHWNMFHFTEGAPQALGMLARRFTRIVVVTNQRCIGKGLLTTEGLQDIHQRMQQAILPSGGRIDRIYHCPDLDAHSPCRKPQPGMALQAQHDFPEINFSRSIMVGNTGSDMQFGKQLGMYTVFIPSTQPHLLFPHPLQDARYDSLLHFAKAIQ
ncbi:D-glycero-D-manno-heptose 1,7-bisphosphate phosphatase/D-glycero-alpha-D-manno-heptose 1-phosphate guanylyltransferase [Chitinophaga costaii]|uniref:D,D-heptose 1,7-bisphosphate phosphatase n=1 Tax=Chitinophaga costaii TaxID=1335309 RepID=A0A1C4CHV4_9BACT|nr:HAD-IIIA family hydrolase [Chitinophaga costaii]PUZ27085.1 HAD-IIIA family hydrolase [Chitinophaga costaii]SCC18642.1 D-glycero-D-manno-heptose 1,7-bisphosphate phosphatase/D-glycero-alpha-D-manno-heptose 1-phosphate guanylyltransferase [Chitinophaga costaii]